MASLLKIRDENGNVFEVPAIVGPPGPSYVLTDADKQGIANIVATRLTSETWTFELEDGSTVTKDVVLK